jgi:hypothetical protein
MWTFAIVKVEILGKRGARHTDAVVGVKIVE